MAEEKVITAPSEIPDSPVPPLSAPGQEQASVPHTHNGVDSPFIDKNSIILAVYSSVPTHTAPEGAIVLYASGSTYRIYRMHGGTWRAESAQAFSADTLLTGTQSISNSSVEGTMYTRVTAANSMLANQVFKVRISGRLTTANGTDYVTIRLKLNAVTIVTITTPLGTVTDAHFFAEFLFTVRSIGASGSFVFAGHGTSSSGVMAGAAIAPTAIDTTAAQNFTVTMQWSNALAGNIVRLDQALTEIVSL